MHFKLSVPRKQAAPVLLFFLVLTLAVIGYTVLQQVRYSSFVSVKASVVEKYWKRGNSGTRVQYAKYQFEYEGNTYTVERRLRGLIIDGKKTLRFNPENPEEIIEPGNIVGTVLLCIPLGVTSVILFLSLRRNKIHTMGP